MRPMTTRVRRIAIALVAVGLITFLLGAMLGLLAFGSAGLAALEALGLG